MYGIPVAGVVKMGRMKPAFLCFAVGAATRHDGDAFHLSKDIHIENLQPRRNATVVFFTFLFLVSCSHEISTPNSYKLTSLGK